MSSPQFRAADGPSLYLIGDPEFRNKPFTIATVPDQSAAASSLSGVSSKAPSLLPAGHRKRGIRLPRKRCLP